MDRCNLEYYVRYDEQVRQAAAESSVVDLIEWLPEGGYQLTAGTSRSSV